MGILGLALHMETGLEVLSQAWDGGECRKDNVLGHLHLLPELVLPLRSPASILALLPIRFPHSTAAA